MNRYPQVIDEDKTLDKCFEKSIARYGDGEWRCATGGGCTSQKADPKLAAELRAILNDAGPNCMVGIPNAYLSPRAESWEKYTEPKFAGLLGNSQPYYSSFITRPDNAPWIDKPEFWTKVRELWTGVKLVLVSGDKKSITSEMIGADAKELIEVHGPRQHAYAEIDRIEAEIIAANPERVILCLGAAATVLAWRLSKNGIHALDLGHLGMFMRHAGAYKYKVADMASDAYRKQLHMLHAKQSWGTGGKGWAQIIEALAIEVDAKTILDYGCGEGTLATTLAAAFPPRRVSGYDPGMQGKEGMPKPCDVVACTDVLEHIEPDKLDAVMDHIYRVTAKAAFFVISCRPAKAILPDGRNAHLMIMPPEQWLAKLKGMGWRIGRHELKKGLNVWAYKNA